MVVLVGRDYQWFYKRTTIPGTKELPKLFFYKHRENLPSSKWRDILVRVLGKYLCDWGSLKERCCWGWDWKSRLILKCWWPPVRGAWLSPAVVGRRGWFWSRAVLHFSRMTCFSCSSDVRAVTSPNDGLPHHVCTCTRPGTHLPLWGIRYFNQLEVVAKEAGVSGSHVRMKNEPGCHGRPVAGACQF